MEGEESGDTLNEWHVPVDSYMGSVLNSLSAAVCIVMSAVFSVGSFGLRPNTPPSGFHSRIRMIPEALLSLGNRVCLPRWISVCFRRSNNWHMLMGNPSQNY